MTLKQVQEMSNDTPIAILVNAYMSSRDIVDMVNKNYRHIIKPLQERYAKSTAKLKDSSGKSEIKKVRDDFIYKSRKLPISKLVAEVNKRFPRKSAEPMGNPYEYTYIQKIIKREVEKRK